MKAWADTLQLGASLRSAGAAVHNHAVAQGADRMAVGEACTKLVYALNEHRCHVRRRRWELVPVAVQNAAQHARTLHKQGTDAGVEARFLTLLDRSTTLLVQACAGLEREGCTA